MVGVGYSTSRWSGCILHQGGMGILILQVEWMYPLPCGVGISSLQEEWAYPPSRWSGHILPVGGDGISSLKVEQAYSPSRWSGCILPIGGAGIFSLQMEQVYPPSRCRRHIHLYIWNGYILPADEVNNILPSDEPQIFSPILSPLNVQFYANLKYNVLSSHTSEP